MTDDPPDDGKDATLDPTAQRTAVRERYGTIARTTSSCCGTDTATSNSATDVACGDGYSDADRDAVEPGADLGLGCGNPTAIASLETGDTVLDLGAGAGFDCFLAAREVGEPGRVVGVDMTPEMVEKARENADANDADNVEFRLGEIEHLPVADAVVDVIVSNCVVNLSPDKPQVFREAYRVLRPGGRLSISDLVAVGDIPDDVRADPDSVAACVGGASSVSSLESMLTDAGFTDVAVETDTETNPSARRQTDEVQPSGYVVPATITAKRPESETSSA